MTQEKKKLIRLDSTSFDAFTKCERMFYNMNIRGLVPVIDDKYLSFGSAFHLARETLRKGGTLEEATQRAALYFAKCNCSKMPPRSMNDLIKAVKEYYNTYCRDNDTIVPLVTTTGDKAIELPFSMPLIAGKSVDVNLDGVIDEVGLDTTQDTGELLIVDAKTTSSTQPKDYHAGWRTSPQMCIYSYAVKLAFGLSYFPKIIVDAVFLRKDGDPYCLRNQQPFEIESWIMYRVIARLHNVAHRLIEISDSGREYYYDYGACKGKFSECPFSDLCKMHEATQGMMVNGLFKTREYNPATFKD